MDDLIKKFTITDSAVWNPPNRIYDYHALLGASDEEFGKFYLGTMDELWSDFSVIPKCIECKEQISGATNLRRYYGRNTHPQCFGLTRKKINDEQRDNYEPSTEVKSYLDRVEKLDLTNLSISD